MSVTEPETISSSQRRPRAIALTRRARRSIRVGRISFLGMPCGTRICLDLLDGGFCHGIESKWPSAASDASSSADFTRHDVHEWSPDRIFAQDDLYTTHWRGIANREIEKFFFGQLDNS